MLDLLRKKLPGIGWGEIVRSQIEALVFWLAGGLPGVPGFAIRSAVYRLLFKKLDGWCWIQPGVTIIRASRLSVGKNFGCNTGTYIGATAGVTIGDYVLIGPNVTITSGMHPIDGLQPRIVERPVVHKPVVIEDDVWIGSGAAIMPGVTLRKGSVIGANSVVNRDTEAYGVYVGAPARKIRSR